MNTNQKQESKKTLKQVIQPIVDTIKQQSETIKQLENNQNQLFQLSNFQVDFFFLTTKQRRDLDQLRRQQKKNNNSSSRQTKVSQNYSYLQQSNTSGEFSFQSQQQYFSQSITNVSNPKVVRTNQMVFISRGGQIFHQPTCQHFSIQFQKMIMEDAIESGISPCEKQIEQLRECYTDLSNKFWKEDPQKFVDGTENIKIISQQMEETFKNQSKNIMILYGLPGFGKKSSLKKSIEICAESHLNIAIITLNTIMDNKETNMIQSIQKQMAKYQQKNQKLSGNMLSMENLNQYFKQFENQVQGILLIIDGIDVLAQAKKQFFLYSILEWYQISSLPLVIAGLTSDLQFFEKLEKRVKSRLQHKQFYFYDIDVDFLIKILSSRFAQSKNKKNNELIKAYQSLLKSEELIHFLNKYIQKGSNISDMLLLFRFSFNHVKLCQENQCDLMQTLDQASQLIYPRIKLALCQSCSVPEQIILFSLYSLIMQQKPEIVFDTVIQYITSKLTQFRTQKQMLATSYTSHVYNKTLDNLIKINLIKLQINSKNLEQNQLVLNVPLDDMVQFIDQMILQTTQHNLEDFFVK
ncbi:hypothetical protein pb186bvf_015446 [Paramecium bursaria]